MPLISFIPTNYENGFKELALLDEDIFTNLAEALSSVSLSSSVGDLVAKVIKIKNLGNQKVGEIFSSVEALIDVLEEEENIDEISNNVVSILQFKRLINEVESYKLKTRLTHLLTDRKIFYAYKASDLVTENANVFISCKIITDIRPIFDLNVDQPPSVGMTTHTLHIHYDSDSAAPHKDFYISLNSYDIHELLDALIRADRKEESLMALYKRAGITNIND